MTKKYLSILFISIVSSINITGQTPKKQSPSNENTKKKDSLKIYNNQINGNNNTIVNGNVTKKYFIKNTKKNYIIYQEPSQKAITLYPKRKVKGDTIRISLGGFTCGYTKNTFDTQTGLLSNKYSCIKIGSEDLLKIKIKNNQLQLSAKIYDIDDKIVGELIENKFIANKINVFKIRKDSSSLEIIDQHDIPVLQMKFLDNNRIWVGGAIYTGTSAIIANGNSSMSLLKNGDPKKSKTENYLLFRESYISFGRQIKSIF